MFQFYPTGEPRVGIFRLFNGKLIVDSTPISDAEPFWQSPDARWQPPEALDEPSTPWSGSSRR
jgi:hypothetical protein